MSFREWEDMPRRIGWKHEYWDGHARLSPRQALVYLRLALPELPCGGAGAQVRDGYRLRSPTQDDADTLQDLHLTAFDGCPEFFGWPSEKVNLTEKLLVFTASPGSEDDERLARLSVVGSARGFSGGSAAPGTA